MKLDRPTLYISVLGTIITFASMIASIAQYRAADLQAQAAIVALMPQIEVRALLEKKTDSEMFTDRRLEITSDGGPVYNFALNRLTWFEIRTNRKVVLEQPLIGYYFSSFPTGKTKGALDTIIGYKNHERFIDFDNRARLALPLGAEISDPMTVLQVQYRDAMRRDQVEYFHVYSGTVIRLSDQEGQTLWQRQSALNKSVQAVDIDKLSSDEVVRALLDKWLTALKS